ncbi:MAG: hypothetical protein K0R65_1502 [Crocinitomicaceae bacterium]|jgi:hypothetical protein|nr:hypothetical protein [Crocinitomicaceae bacterium]
MEIQRITDLTLLREAYRDLKTRLYGKFVPEQFNADFFECGYVVSEDNNVLSALALYNNPKLKLKGKHAYCFGHFEAENNPEAIFLLFGELLKDLEQKRDSYLIGPMNGSTWDTYRLNDFENTQPFLLEQVHPFYYNELLELADFDVLVRYQSRIDYEIPCNKPETLELEKRFGENGVIFRKIDLENYDKELEKLFPFISKAFETNFLYTPISSAHFTEKYLQAKQIIQPDYVRIAENANGETIGFVFCYPNLLETKEKQLVVKTIARNPDPEWKGLGNVLVNQVFSLIKQQGFQSVIHAYMIDQGTSTGISNAYLGQDYKSYKLYFKEL